MDMKPSLNLSLRPALIMTPRLQQALKLLQVPTLELQQILKQEIMQNPLLEEVDELSPDLAASDRAELVAALANTAQQGGAVVWLGAPGGLDVDVERLTLLVGGRVVVEGPAAEVAATAEFRLLRNRELAGR